MFQKSNPFTLVLLLLSIFASYTVLYKIQNCYFLNRIQWQTFPQLMFSTAVSRKKKYTIPSW